MLAIYTSSPYYYHRPAWFQLRTSTIAKDFIELDRESKDCVLWPLGIENTAFSSILQFFDYRKKSFQSFFKKSKI